MQLCFACLAYFLSSVEFPHRAFCSESPSSSKMSRTLMAEAPGIYALLCRWPREMDGASFSTSRLWLNDCTAWENMKRKGGLRSALTVAGVSRGQIVLCPAVACSEENLPTVPHPSRLCLWSIYPATELLAMRTLLKPPFISALGPFVIWSSTRPFFPVYHSSLRKELKVQIIDFYSFKFKNFLEHHSSTACCIQLVLTIRHTPGETAMGTPCGPWATRGVGPEQNTRSQALMGTCILQAMSWVWETILASFRFQSSGSLAFITWIFWSQRHSSWCGVELESPPGIWQNRTDFVRESSIDSASLCRLNKTQRFF